MLRALSSRSVPANERRDEAGGTARMRQESGGSSTSATGTQVSIWMGSITFEFRHLPLPAGQRFLPKLGTGRKSSFTVVSDRNRGGWRMEGVWDNGSGAPSLLTCCCRRWTGVGIK